MSHHITTRCCPTNKSSWLSSCGTSNLFFFFLFFLVLFQKRRSNVQTDEELSGEGELDYYKSPGQSGNTSAMSYVRRYREQGSRSYGRRRFDGSCVERQTVKKGIKGYCTTKRSTQPNPCLCCGVYVINFLLKSILPYGCEV